MPDLAMLDYFYGDEAEQFTFYRIPKVLFTDPSYRRISSDAKILYGLMLDRMGLSVRNGWLDEYNRVFIFFTLEDALEYLCCGHTKAVSLFGELDKAGLIERKKQGQGKPTKIYVKNFVRNAEVLTSEKRKSKVPQSGSQDFQKTASNNTEIKDTELSDTEPSIHPARGLPEDKSPAADAMDTMRVYRQIIMENIEYDITRRQLGYDADILDEIVDIMVDTVCSTKPMIRIGGQDFPLEVVKSRLLKLNSEHKHEMEGFILADKTVLLQKERDAHGNYYGGISLDGMMFKIPKMYAPVTDETGRITAFRQMREKDFSRGQPQKKPEKKPSIREQLAKKPEQHTAAKPPAKRKDLER